MGRASNRKKQRRWVRAQREGFEALVQMRDKLMALDEAKAAARSQWIDAGGEVRPPDTGTWPKNSLGDRFISSVFHKPIKVPSIRAATVPAAATIEADPGHWDAAVDVLVRSVVLDGVDVDDAAVTDVLQRLDPVVQAELQAARDTNLRTIGPVPGFPDDHQGPVFQLGASTLVDATWAVIGEDPLAPVLEIVTEQLAPALAGYDHQAVVRAMIAGTAHHFRFEQPGDAEALTEVGPSAGDPLHGLVAQGHAEAGQIMRLGLTTLKALAGLGLSEHRSILSDPVWAGPVAG